MTDGEYLHIDGRPALRFVRDLPHPAARVWTMLTEGLVEWFPARPAFDGGLVVGAPVRFTFTADGDGGGGTVLAVDPPRRIAFTWEGDELWFDLAESPSGTRLTFTTVLAADDTAARNAAGWEACLAALRARLAGADPDPVPWRSIYDAYVDAGVPSGAPFPEA